MRGSARAAAAVVIALTAAARADVPASPFERGVARFRAEDFAGALAPLEQAHAADPDDADTALLLGITYYRLGRADDARPLLELAAARGDADDRASARVFLGLIADERGDSERARDYYALVARSSGELATSARLLLEHDGPQRWSLVAIVRPGYDSNVALQPATVAPGPGAGNPGDSDLSLIGSATVRPFEDTPLVLDTTVLYRAYAQQTSYDMLADAIGATATMAGARDRATLAYHYDASTLGGARYELAHVVDASYRHALGAGLAAGASYSFAARDYAQDAYAGYTGLYHTAGAELAWGSPRGPAEASAGYVFEREGTDDATLASIGHGGRGQLHIRLGDAADLRASAEAIHRTFDAAAMGRIDTSISADAALYVDVTDALGFVLGASLVRNVSNVADYDYMKWTAFAGLIATALPQ